MWFGECLDGPGDAPSAHRWLTWVQVLASGLQPLTFLPHYLWAPVSLFLQLWALALTVFISPPFCLFKSYAPFFFLHTVIIKAACCTIFFLPLIVLQLSFLYKSLFSPSTCPCKKCVPSFSSSFSASSSSLRHCSSAQFVSVSSSVTSSVEEREGKTRAGSSQGAELGDSIRVWKQSQGRD